jgi:two-component system, chemotaxis family, chemotaxis protein CheY
MSSILQRSGYEVVGEAESGKQAVEEYKRLRPDVVTLDIVMRDMSGIDALREIRKFDGNARVVMCTAMANQHLMAEARAAGAREFVTKPFQPSRLLEAVNFVLA